MLIGARPVAAAAVAAPLPRSPGRPTVLQPVQAGSRATAPPRPGLACALGALRPAPAGLGTSRAARQANVFVWSLTCLRGPGGAGAVEPAAGGGGLADPDGLGPVICGANLPA